jgi:hypothetical protein
MDLTRREAVRMAGLAAAAASLSCGPRAPEGAAAEVQEGEEAMAETATSHTLTIKRCGQYVVVEVESPGPRAFRGRLEVAPGDTVKIFNRTGGAVRLEFPEGITWDREAKALQEVVIVEGDRVYEIGPEETPVSIRIASTAPEGRYEYVVLFETSILTTPGQAPPIVSKWAHAIGGSSSEFIIRKPPGP